MAQYCDLQTLRESHAVIIWARRGMGPDGPGQLYTKEMTAWDSFSHP